MKQSAVVFDPCAEHTSSFQKTEDVSMGQPVTDKECNKCHHAPNRIFEPIFGRSTFVTCEKCNKPIQLTKKSKKPMVIFEILLAVLNLLALILVLFINVSTLFRIVFLSINAVGAGLRIFIIYRCRSKGEYQRARVHAFDQSSERSYFDSTLTYLPVYTIAGISMIKDFRSNYNFVAFPLLLLMANPSSVSEEFIDPETAVLNAAMACKVIAFAACLTSGIYQYFLFALFLFEIAKQLRILWRTKKRQSQKH